MPMETAKCPKCGSDGRRTGMTKEADHLVKHMVCAMCGQPYRVKLT